MENLEKDPIIEFYLSFSHSTVQESDLPVFSETLLRLAARHALGNVRPVEVETLSLYRKLILFYYAESYTAVDDLLKIMPCFSENELIKCFEDFETIKGDWLSFTQNNLLYFIRKKAFFAIFTEWTRRYVQLHDELDSSKLRSQAIKIHAFFKWGTKGINQWLRSFESNTLKGNWAKSDTAKVEGITEKDLRIANIAIDIKDQLHPLIYKELQEILMNSTESSDNESEASEKALNSSPSPAKRSRTATPKEIDLSPQTIHLQAEVSEQDGDIVQVVEVSETESEANDDDTSTELEEGEAEEEATVINDEKATAYLSALQAYVVVNGLYDAIPLLDRVDSILRAKLEHKKEKTP